MTEAEGAAGDAHVGVDSCDEDVADFFGFEKVPDFAAGIADGILVLIDLDEVDLPLPRGFGVSSLGGELFGPFLVCAGFVIGAAVGLVDGVDGGFFTWDLAAPLVDGVGGACGGRGVDGSESGGGVVVCGHAGAGGVDDEGTVGACFFEKFVKARGEFFFAGDGVRAGVGVPHVAHDDGAEIGVPLFFGCFACVTGSRLEGEAPWFSGERCRGEKD